jgi:hypothetical protein
MATFKKTVVSIKNTNACIKPTKNSIPMKKEGSKNITKILITEIKILPANIFPNNLKLKEIILANSEINSSIPIGDKNFLTNLNPLLYKAKKLTKKTEIIANANVKFRSENGDLNK